MTTRTRSNRIAALRRDREQLLSAFPKGQLPATGQAALDADIADFGPPRDPRPFMQGGWVGAPVRAEEFAGKSEDDVFAVLDKYPDDSTRSPLWDSQGDVSRSGNVLQQADAFAKFAVTNIEMGRSMLKRLSPGRHERYASAILSNWIDPKQDSGRSHGPVVPATDIEQLLLSLIKTGFNSPGFRISVAQVLQGVAKNNKGLSLDSLAILTSWLPETASPERGECEPRDLKASEHSILYSTGGGWTCTSGRASIVKAITMGWLYQSPPKIDETVQFLEELSETEYHPAVWAEVLVHVTWLFNSNSVKMTALVSKLFETLPELMTYSQIFYVLSDIAGNVSPAEVEAGWIAKFLGRPDQISHLLAGELTILNFVRSKTKWAKDLIDAELHEQHDKEFLRGITFGAAAFITEKSLADKLEPIISQSLASPDPHLRDAALTFLHLIDEKTWTPSSKRLVEQILQSELHQERNTEMIASQMESVALVDPTFALFVAEHYAQKMREDVSRSNDWSWGASHLTNIALAAQRTADTRERGLQLFENLLDLSVQDAKKAADLMNHREEVESARQN